MKTRLLSIRCLSLLLLFTMLLGLGLVGCNRQNHPDDGGDQPPTPVEIPDDTEAPEDLTAFRVFAEQAKANKPILRITYDYNGLVIPDSYEPTVSFYYQDQLLACRRVGTLSSTLIEEVCFGLVTVKFTVKNESGTLLTLKEGTVPVFADEYNFASLNASFPVLYFTLDLFSRNGGTMENYSSKDLPLMRDVPTFISLERATTYNWDCLPEHVYSLPAIPEEEVRVGDFGKHNDVMAAYILELYQIHPDSHFHFYCVDNYPELILKFFIAQGIENYDAVMISDGTATIANYQYLTRPAAEHGATPKEVYDKMVAEWERLKLAAVSGEKNYLDGVFMGNYVASVLSKYAFVIATVEENVTWWCGRRSLFEDNAFGDAFVLDLLNGTNHSGENGAGDRVNLIFPSMGNMFGGLSAADQAAFKALYKFDSDAFSAAYEKNKQVLMIVGTKNESLADLECYIKYLKSLGDGYQIYYKGHPANATALNEEKQAMFDRNGVIDVEGAIAAEVILFYCPDIYLAGYTSTTFISAQPDKILALFCTKQTGATVEQNDGYTAPVFISATADGHYLVEYAENDTKHYFNPETGTLDPIS